VVGWTMGNDPGLQVWQVLLFLWLAMVLYPEPYRFRYQDLPFFFYGLVWGQSCPRLDLHVDRQRPLEEIRAEVMAGIAPGYGFGCAGSAPAGC